MDWGKLQLQCDNPQCPGEWNPKTDQSQPYARAYAGRKLWAHGYRCPGCGQTTWLQHEPWSASPYDHSPIQTWGVAAYTFLVSFALLLVGIIVHQLSGKAGFYLQVVATTGAFTGGIGLVRKEMLLVADGKKSEPDKRLLVPLFSSAVLLPVLFLFVDPEPLLIWGVPSSLIAGYLVGSVLQTRFSPDRGPPN